LENRLRLILGLGILIVTGVWFFREPLRGRIRERATLANEAPASELVDEMIEQADEPRADLLAAWNSGRIVHRERAVRSFPNVVRSNQPLPLDLENLLLSAALDPDLSVREAALGILQARRHPALAAVAAEQLRDVDPQVRWLGLRQLKSVDAATGVPMVIPLLNDPDPTTIALSLRLLESWSGRSFGVTLGETAAIENEQTGLWEYRPGSLERAGAGAAQAREWWLEHHGSFPPAPLPLPAAAGAARSTVPAGDFQLRTLAGRSLRLSDFRGKVVLINFWTTWCTACVGEMPGLIALQKKHGDSLAILGVSLDFVPDSHGHTGGHSAAEEPAPDAGDHEDHEAPAVALKRIREKVARTIEARGINYPILLDERNEVGGRFNGGELPTTVIIDGEGKVRRRFVGARSLPVLEAMIAQAGRKPGLP